MKTLQDAIKRIKELEFIVEAFSKLSKEHEQLKKEHEALKEDYISLRDDHENTKKEVEELWSYTQKLEKYFVACWKGLSAIFNRDHKPYKTAQDAMKDSMLEFPEIFKNNDLK